MIQFLKFCGIVAVMFCIVPLAGFVVTGSVKAAIKYSLAWLRVIGIMLVLSGLLTLALG